jgi:D-serine dehydratase
LLFDKRLKHKRLDKKGEQMVRYYGHYSNVSRGRRKKAQTDNQVPYILESELSPKEFRKKWARLIQKIYEVDPLKCPKCQGSMRVYWECNC